MDKNNWPENWPWPPYPLGTKLYTSPPQRTWVGLTWDDAPRGTGKSADWVEGARWAEAKLKEKNYG